MGFCYDYDNLDSYEKKMRKNKKNMWYLKF